MSSRSPARSSLALWLLAGSCVLLAVLLWLVPRAPRPPSETLPPAAQTAPEGTAARPGEEAAARTSVLPTARPSEPQAERPATKTKEARAVAGRIAIVLDDAGYDLQELAPFLELPGPLTVAVLPNLPQSSEAARRVRSAGKPLLLHSPMEPVGDEDPGPGAILAGMSSDRIREELERQLDALGAVEGINNHMGSRVTAEPEAVRAILSVAAGRGLVFLDSRTSAASVVSREAAGVGALAVERDVFLDNDPDREALRLQLEEAKRIARSRGRAIAIGHVQTPGLAAFLAEALPDLARDGYLLTGVGELAREAAASGGR